MAERARGRARGRARMGRNESRNQEGKVAELSISKLSLGAENAKNNGRRRRDFPYNDVKTRPAHVVDKTGVSGGKLPVMTNFFKLEQAPDWHLYQYHVDYNPPIDSKSLRIALLSHHKELLGKTKAFDGMVLFLPKKLPDEVTEVFSTRESDRTNIKLIITFTSELPPTSPQCIQVYNIIFRRLLDLNDLKQIGRNFYNPGLAVQIPQHKLEVMPGFITSILQYETNILLNCDITHKILRIDTALDMLTELHNRDPKTFHDAAVRKLVGAVILTRYNNKTYRVDDIDWEKNPLQTFKLHDDTEISYKNYYKKAYDKDISDEGQPLLVSRPKKRDLRRGQTEPIYLIPELCIITGLSPEVRSDYNVMKDVTTHTRIAPQARAETLHRFIDKINSNPKVQEELEGWGLKFSKSLMVLNARVLAQEKVFESGNRELSYRKEDADWCRDMQGKRLISAVDLSNWVVVFTRQNNNLAQQFVRTLAGQAPRMGMRIRNPITCELTDDRNDTYLTALRNQTTSQTQLVMCFVPSARKDRYDAIKKFTCVNHPVPSQVIVQKTLYTKDKMTAIANRVALQLNCKLGGQIWAVEIPLKNVMVIGLDTYHDSAKKGRSVMGCVVSINSTLTRYYSRVTFQHTHQELIDGLKVPLNGALAKYHEVNRSLPEKIFVYRDGVGDGQLAAVVEHELPQMLDTFRKAGGENYNPRVGVVVVKKRINSRFFAKAGPHMTNPCPGTVVDTVITKPEWFDFFLVSQSVRQGTVTPTHYNVVWDSTGLKPDHIQRLTYKLCHLYYNWPGTIRVPAPCQYAHKLAFLVGQSIHKDPAMDLADRLYFL